MSERETALSEIEQKELTYLLDRMLLDGFTAREREIARTVAELVFKHTARFQPAGADPVPPQVCQWREDKAGMIRSDCGIARYFPPSNWWQWCPSCGKPLSLVPAEGDR